MSLLFNGTTQHLERTASIPVVAFPFAIAAWVFIDDLSGDQTIVSLVDSASDDENHSLMLSAGVPRARSRSGGVNGDAIASEPVTLNSWHHVVAFFNAADDRQVFLDGRVETIGSNATSLSPTSLDTYSVSRLSQLTPGNFVSGRVAEITIWNLSAPLTPNEIKSLGQAQLSGLHVRTDEIIVHDKLLGQSPTIDMVGGFSLTHINGPTVADHPPLSQVSFQTTFPVFDPVLRLEDPLVFGQIVGIQKTLNISVVQQWDIFHSGKAHVIQLSVIQQWNIADSAVTGPNTRNIAITQAFLFQDDGRRTIEISVVQPFSIGDDGNRAGVGQNALLFGQTSSLEQSKQASNAWIITDQATFDHAIRHVSATNLWDCGDIAIIDLGDPTNCDLPNSGMELNGDTLFADSGSEIIAPAQSSLVVASTIEFFSTIATAVVIRSPELSNTEQHYKGNIWQRVRGGAPVGNHITSKPRYRNFTFTITSLKVADRDALQVFLNATLGTRIQYTDHNSQEFVGIIMNPATAIQEIHRGRYEAEFELELSNSAAFTP